MNLPDHLLASKLSYLQMPALLPSDTRYIKTMYTEEGQYGVNITRIIYDKPNTKTYT